MAQAIHASDGRRWRWNTGVPIQNRWQQLETEIEARPEPKYQAGDVVHNRHGQFTIQTRWWFGCWWYHMTDGETRFANKISLKESELVQFRWDVGQTLITPFTQIKCSIAYTYVGMRQNVAVPLYGLKLPTGQTTIYSEADLIPSNPDNQWVVDYKTINSGCMYHIVTNSDHSEAIFTSKLEAYRFARAGIQYHDKVAHTWAQYRVRPYEGRRGEHILTTQTPPSPWRIGEKVITPDGTTCLVYRVEAIHLHAGWVHIYTLATKATLIQSQWLSHQLEPFNQSEEGNYVRY